MLAGLLNRIRIQKMYCINFNSRFVEHVRYAVAAVPIESQGNTAIGGELPGCRDELDGSSVFCQQLLRPYNR
jgi:hypothetical protein